MIAPVELGGLVKTHAVMAAEVTDEQGLTGLALSRGGYVEMHGPGLNQWLVPPRGVDALVRDEQGGAWWIASGWAKENASEAEKILVRIADEQLRTARVFEESEEPSAFMAWLYAIRPVELATLGTPTGFGIGAADAGGVFAFQVTGPDALMSGTTAEDTARQWVSAWRNAGRPGWEAVCPVLTREDAGWRVRAEVTLTD